MTSLVKDLSDGVRLIQLMVRPSFIYQAYSHIRGRKSWVCSTYFRFGWCVPNAQLVLGDVSLGRYNKNPRMRVQKAENVNRALEFINSRGVKLTNIGPEGSPLIGNITHFPHTKLRYYRRKLEANPWNDMDVGTSVYHCRY